MKWLIRHFKWFDKFGILHTECSHKPGDIVTDSKGTQYEVQKNHSIKRINVKHK